MTAAGTSPASAGTSGPAPAGAPGVAGLLLAAGEGRRLGRAKATVEFRGVRLVDRGVRTLLAGGCGPVVVVTGAVPLEVPGAVVAHNRHWRSGMGSSLRAGLAAIPPACPAVVVALVDQPLVSGAAVERLRTAFDRGAGVAAASYRGRTRNPVLLAREHFDAVAARAIGDIGARPFLRAHPALVTLVPCDDVAAAEDIDTPADLDRLSRRAH